MKRAELQERIAAIRIEVRPGQHIRLGASAGAAVFPEDGTTYEALLADADRRMYRDKSARRNGIVVPADTDASGWNHHAGDSEPVETSFGSSGAKM